MLNPEKHQLALFLLGAGFSKPAGLPLGPELFDVVREEARRSWGAENAIERDIALYCKYLREVEGVDENPESVDLEQFMSFLDIEHYLGLLGPDTLSDEGNASQILLKKMIARVLHQRTRAALEMPLPQYEKFIDLLKPRDVILTLNYDNLLECLLDRANKPYRLFPHRSMSSGPYSDEIDSSVEEITILKLHGSIDWFNREPFEEIWEAQRLVDKMVGEATLDAEVSVASGEAPPKISPFGDGGSEVQKLVEGPWREDDSLLSIFKISDADTYWSYKGRKSPPFILSPSYQKLLYSSPLHSFWWGLGEAGTRCVRFGIIGYSLPQHDDYMKQLLYKIVRGFDESREFSENAGFPKQPIAIIDYRTTEHDKKELRDRYRFALLGDTHLQFEGFSEKTIDELKRLWSSD